MGKSILKLTAILLILMGGFSCKVEDEIQKIPEVEEIEEENKAQLLNCFPNPFMVFAEIHFYIPQNATSAKLLIRDVTGREVKLYDITTTGMGKVVIQASDLPSVGMYIYTLIVNDTIIGNGKMVLQK